jgi:glycosyltransferase involved in cell wall biosynthesis
VSNPFDVTTIVAVKNGERFLKDALESIRAQPNVAVELIVVDGASADRSREIAEAFGAKILNQVSGGLADAWNAGIMEASAPYIAFLDSDDRWIPDTLAARILQLERHPSFGLSIGRVRHALETGVSLPGGSMRDHLLQDRLAPIPGTMLFRRPVFDSVGLFDPTYEISSDADWIARSIGLGVSSCDFDKLVLLKRVHSENLTRRVTPTQQDLLSLLRRKIGRSRKPSGFTAEPGDR